MVKTVKKPICIICGRGSKHNLASLGGNEPFYLIPSEVKKDGLYQGKQWNIICGDCMGRYIYGGVDWSNLISANKEIDIIIFGKQVEIVVH